MKNRITLLNMISGLLLQVCTLISGLILPKIILVYFGSEVNGLVSSLNQFLSYITLIEGGVGSVIVANLYKPIVNKDYEQLSSVAVTANKFYRKIGIIFIAYSITLAIVYPLIFDTEFSYTYVFLLVAILSINLIVQYMFSLTLKNILEADKKIFVVNFVQIVIVIANVLLAITSVSIFPSIHILKLISGFLYIMQPLVFKSYVDSHYNIDWNANTDNSLIASRWNGFAINFAAFIHYSTDITILTIFTNLKIVSIYSVYSLVSTGLRQLVCASVSGISATVGQSYAKCDYEQVNRKLDIYEYIMFILTFFFFTVAALLITPFVQIYTKGINDTNYYQPVFGVLLLVSEAFYLLKLPHMNLAYNANKFKEITPATFMEACLNIVVSLILVKKFGLIGVTLGTIVGMVYRTVFHVYFTSKLIMREQLIFYKKFVLFLLFGVIGFIVCFKFVPLIEVTAINWIIHGIIYSLIIGGFYAVLSFIFFKSELKFFVGYLRR